MLERFVPVISTYSDVSNWGYGAIHNDDWVVGAFNEIDDRHVAEYAGHHHGAPNNGIRSAHLNIREMWGVYAACQRWGKAWGDCSVILITDSAVVQVALNMGRSLNKAIMHYLRRLFWMAVEENVEFRSVYIRSGVNTICDALSRLDDVRSVSRIKDVDVGNRSCCGHLFNVPVLHYRAGNSESGAGGISTPILLQKLDNNKGGAGEEIPRVC